MLHQLGRFALSDVGDVDGAGDIDGSPLCIEFLKGREAKGVSRTTCPLDPCRNTISWLLHSSLIQSLGWNWRTEYARRTASWSRVLRESFSAGRVRWSNSWRVTVRWKRQSEDEDTNDFNNLEAGVGLIRRRANGVQGEVRKAACDTSWEPYD